MNRTATRWRDGAERNLRSSTAIRSIRNASTRPGGLFAPDSDRRQKARALWSQTPSATTSARTARNRRWTVSPIRYSSLLANEPPESVWSPIWDGDGKPDIVTANSQRATTGATLANESHPVRSAGSHHDGTTPSGASLPQIQRRRNGRRLALANAGKQQPASHLVRVQVVSGGTQHPRRDSPANTVRRHRPWRHHRAPHLRCDQSKSRQQHRAHTDVTARFQRHFAKPIGR